MSRVPASPPGASVVARRRARSMVQPLARFLRIEAASGIVLLIAAAVALAWANSPWGASYEAAWTSELTAAVGPWSFHASLRFVVNEVLMAVFFFVVGLEIRRELHEGELRELRRAALPIVAALGGMLAPAAIYAMIGGGGDAARGWGVPMATDIAFALGVLSLLGSRVAPGLRVLLLAVAIIDDIGAILVIAIFYSAGVDPSGLAIAAAGVVGILALQRLGVRRDLVYLVPAAAIWLGMLRAGIHPTIAGVIVGLMTPVRAWFGIEGFVDVARHELDEIARPAAGAAPHALGDAMARLARAQREARSPVERLEAALHPWIAFAVMPVFALANAGVAVRGIALGDGSAVAIGVAIALVVGKLTGVVAATALAVRLGVAALPSGVRWTGVVVVGAVAGIGFTMALFIAELAFTARADLHALAKLGVLAGSAIAAAVALVLGRGLLPRGPAPEAPRDAATSGSGDA